MYVQKARLHVGTLYLTLVFSAAPNLSYNEGVMYKTSDVEIQ